MKALSELSAHEPSFPPLFSGEAVQSGVDPFKEAVARARKGTEPGLIMYRIRPDYLSAALVLAPETTLDDAISMVLVASVGFTDSFGSVSPSEVAAQIDWPGTFRINGARCGGIRAASSTFDPLIVPDWLVIGLEVPFFAQDAVEPGQEPDTTTLWDEGCSDIEPRQLLESWSRHVLVWMHDWLEDGLARIHSEWTGRAYSIGKTIEIVVAGDTYSGQFIGLDEKGGMLLKIAGNTELLPLTLILEEV